MMRFGADPEFFLVDERGSFVPAVGLLPGTKAKPYKLGSWGFVHEDNVMVELGVEPSGNFSNVYSLLQDAREQAVHMAARKYGGYLEAAREPVATFTEAQLDSPQAQTFGCDPDFGAYTMGQQLPAVGTADLGTRRAAGGHIHVSYETSYELPPFVVAAFCDLFVGLGLVCVGEAQQERRETYGQAGRFRPKPYGLEYRTPCNSWLFRARIAGHVQHGLERLAGLVEGSSEREVRRVFDEVPWGDVRACINSENRQKSVDLNSYLQDEVLGGH